MFESYKYQYDRLLDTQIENHLYAEILTALHSRYGSDPDAVIMNRIEAEWEAINRNDTIEDVAFLHEFTTWIQIQRMPCQVRPGA